MKCLEVGQSQKDPAVDREDHLAQVGAEDLSDLSPPAGLTSGTVSFHAAGRGSHAQLSGDMIVFWELQAENQLPEPSCLPATLPDVLLMYLVKGT